MTRFPAVLGVAIGASCGLSGCSNEPEASYPASVRAILERAFPADGRIHAQSHGSFRVTPVTHFCTYRPGYGLDGKQVTDALAAIDRSDDRNAVARANGIFGERVSPECTSGGADGPIFVRGEEALGRNGKPYKITIAVWQGDAAWVAAVERPDGKSPDVSIVNVGETDGPNIFGPSRSQLQDKAKVDASKFNDVSDITAEFMKFIARGEK